MINNLKKTTFKQEDSEIKAYGSIYLNKEDESFTLSSEKLSEGNNSNMILLAECFYNKVIDKKGWDKLSINTYKAAKAHQQAFLAGYLEGRMTAEDIFNFYDNLRTNTKNHHSEEYDKIYTFFTHVADALKKHVERLQNEFETMEYEDKKYWTRILLGYTQLEGLIKGYTYQIEKMGQTKNMQLTMTDFLLLQADGEIPELIRSIHSKEHLQKKTKPGDPNYFEEAFGIKTEDPMTFWGQLMWTSKCSAFIKITKNENGTWNDLLAGHTTWTEYYEMLRTYKQYI
jgi:hypothetical protein